MLAMLFRPHGVNYVYRYRARFFPITAQAANFMDVTSYKTAIWKWVFGFFR